MTRWQRGALLALTVLAFGLRVWGADQSAPYVPDTQIIREALDLGQKLSTGSTNFDIGLGGAPKYPLVLPYILLPIYGVIFIGGRLAGLFHSTQDFTGWLFLNRVAIHVVTVALIAFLGALTVPLTFLIARRFEKRTAPWIAAAFVTFSLTLVQFSHHARPHVPLAFFVLLTLYFSLRVYDTGSLRDYLLAGASVALATGTLQNGILAIIPFGVAHLLRIDFRRRIDWLKSLVTWRLAAGLVVMGVGCMAAYPQLVLRPQTVIKLVETREGETAVVVGGKTGTGLDGFQLGYVPKNLAYLFDYEPVLAALGLIGFVYFFVRAKFRADHLILASFAGVFLAVFGLLRFTLPHYFSPLVPVLAIFGARVMTDLKGVLDRKFPSLPLVIAGGLSSLLIMPLAVYAFRLDYVLGQIDTRSQARDWIVANLPSGTSIGAEFRLELYPTQDSIRRQQAETTDVLGTREQWLSNLPLAEYPSPAFALTNLDVYPVSMPSEINELVVRHQIQYLVFEQYQATWRNDSTIYDYALMHGTRVAVFCPGLSLDNRLYYALPDDISVPWLALWRVQFPGPIVQIFSMQPPLAEQPRLPSC